MDSFFKGPHCVCKRQNWFIVGKDLWIGADSKNDCVQQDWRSVRDSSSDCGTGCQRSGWGYGSVWRIPVHTQTQDSNYHSEIKKKTHFLPHCHPFIQIWFWLLKCHYCVTLVAYYACDCITQYQNSTIFFLLKFLKNNLISLPQIYLFLLFWQEKQSF